MNSLRSGNMFNWLLVCVALLLNVFVYKISIEKLFIEEMILTSVVLFSFYQFASYVMQKKYYIGYIIVFAGLLLISISQTVGLGTFFLYNSSFTYGYALSILNSNVQEMVSMLSTMLLWIVFFLLNIAFQYFVVIRSGRLIKNSKVIISVGVLWLLIPFGSLAHSIMTNRGVEDRISIALRNSPLFNFRPISLAYSEYVEMKEIQNFQPNYTLLDVSDENVSTVVLVIGESARRSNMSLYGYDRKTTPFQSAEVGNMMLFNNMVSSASITLFSVPLLLSNLKPENYKSDKHKLGDNVIQLANYLGYKTYWLSTQEEGNMYVSTVSNLAKFSQKAKWYTGFDEVLIDELSTVLGAKEEKKFIILHINGSHSNACDKYPEKANYFIGYDRVVDCYDNTIRYTDSILNEVFSLLRNRDAALVYLSDHAEKKDNDRFIHSDSKEGTEIPYYIWYGMGVKTANKEIGEVNELNSLELNYYNIAKLLGVKNLFYQKPEGISFLKSDMSIVEYEKLMP